MSNALRDMSTPSGTADSSAPAGEQKPGASGSFKERVAALSAPALSAFVNLRAVVSVLKKPVMLTVFAGGQSPMPIPLWAQRGMPVLMLLATGVMVYRWLLHKYPRWVFLLRGLLVFFVALLVIWFILMSMTRDTAWIRRGMLGMALVAASFTGYRLFSRKHARWVFVLRGASVLFTVGMITWSLATFGF